MKHTLLIALLISFLPLQAQRKATTEDGKIVILLDDGTWQESREVRSVPKAESKGDCKYATNNKDDFTGARQIVLKESKLAKGLNGTLLRVDEVRAFFINYLFDLGCVTPESYVLFKFVDGSTLKVMHSGEGIDCGEGVTFQGFIGAKEFDPLSTKEISRVRVSYSESISDFDVLDPTYFLYGIPCLLTD